MNNELFTVKPSLKQFYGRTVTKETYFDEQTDDGSVHQVLKDLVLTTEITKEWNRGECKNTMKCTQTEELAEGEVLIWDETQGYIIPHVAMYKLRDLEEEIKEIKEIYKDNTDINPVT
jgi:hypothetical protein